jgi:hypothetical protein
MCYVNENEKSMQKKLRFMCLCVRHEFHVNSPFKGFSLMNFLKVKHMLNIIDCERNRIHSLN